MTGMQRELVVTGIVSGCFGIIFSLAILVHKLVPSRPELSRKTAHLFGGLIALSFPFIFKSFWGPFVLSLGFFFFLVVMKLVRHFNAVHGVKRRSFGAYLFPLSLLLILILGYDKPYYYFVAVLVLAVSDTTAALVGGKYGSIKFEIEGNVKSLEGAIAFIFVTFLCVHLPLLLMTDIGRGQSVIISLVIAIAVCGFELMAIAGTDNLFLPLGTFYIVERMVHYPMITNLGTVISLTACMVLTPLLFIKSKNVKPSFIIALSLLNFASLSLIEGSKWVIPLFIFEALFIIFNHVYNWTWKDESAIRKYGAKSAIFIGIIPAAVIFVPATFHNYDEIFPIFALSIASIASQIFIYYYAIFNYTYMRPRFNQRFTGPKHLIVSEVLISLLTTICIAVIPALFIVKNYNVWMLLSLPLFVIMAWITNIIITKVFEIKCNVVLRDDFIEDDFCFGVRIISTAFACALYYAVYLLL